MPVIAVRGSQAEGLHNRFWDSLLWNIRGRWAGYSDGYSIEAEVTPLAELGFVDSDVADAPEGAIGIRYTSDSAGYTVTDLDSGAAKGEVDAWTSSGAVIIVPTDGGRRLWRAEAQAREESQ